MECAHLLALRGASGHGHELAEEQTELAATQAREHEAQSGEFKRLQHKYHSELMKEDEQKDVPTGGDRWPLWRRPALA